MEKFNSHGAVCAATSLLLVSLVQFSSVQSSDCKGHVLVVITKPDTLLLFCGLGTHLLYFYGLIDGTASRAAVAV